MVDKLIPRQFQQSDGVEDWRVLGEGACAFFPTASFEASVRFAQAIAALSGIADDPPDVDIRRDGVTVRTVTNSDGYYGMSKRNVEIARQVSAAAREQGLTADPSVVQNLLIIPGALKVADVMPFWRAALGYEPRLDSPDEDLIDPRDRGPAFWFETMDEPRADGGGAIHIVVWVPYDQAQARVDAALAAGGRMVHDKNAPSWWTIADPAGNQIDIATTNSRP